MIEQHEPLIRQLAKGMSGVSDEDIAHRMAGSIIYHRGDLAKHAFDLAIFLKAYRLKVLADEGERYRHVKRGSTYRALFTAKVQTSTPIVEGDEVVVYRAEETLDHWARLTKEFEDGRFEKLPVEEKKS